MFYQLSKGTAVEGGVGVRYRYISYKYSRKVSSDSALQNIWETFGTWAVPVASDWRPPTDVYETPDRLIVLIEAAGVTEEDLSVTLFSDLLVVEGTRDQPPFFKAGMSACHQLGIKFGEFRTEIYIPVTVDHDNVTAEYKNGLLKIVLRKVE
jgi:HSP20 family molecular chaperone IbpA